MEGTFFNYQISPNLAYTVRVLPSKHLIITRVFGHVNPESVTVDVDQGRIRDEKVGRWIKRGDHDYASLAKDVAKIIEDVHEGEAPRLKVQISESVEKDVALSYMKQAIQELRSDGQ